LDNLQRVQCVYLVDVLLQLISWLSLNLLDLLQTALLDERLLCCRIIREGLRELVQDIVKNLSRASFDQRLQGTQVRTHLKNTLQCLLCLLLQVLRTLRITIQFKQ
jgi:hypothetical protein